MPWYEHAATSPDSASLLAAQAHQSILTKPSGALGVLETVAEQFAAWQGKVNPQLDNVAVRIFAGDHGVCAQGVSAFPQEVTVQMIANFCAGGAAISVLSAEAGADLSVINMGVANPLMSSDGVIDVQLMAGTHDFTEQPAMTMDIVFSAMAAGAAQVPSNAQLCIGGEMGIGNTTSASAIYCALLSVDPVITVGPGAGVDERGVHKKQAVIAKALALHSAHLDNPLAILRCLGGLEIAALTGFYIASAQAGIPALVDGSISTAAALLACRINPSVRAWLLFAHESAEPAHKIALNVLDATPLLNLGMRLGEGSGAALAVGLLRSALALHNNMATFEQAGVSSAQ